MCSNVRTFLFSMSLTWRTFYKTDDLPCHFPLPSQGRWEWELSPFGHLEDTDEQSLSWRLSLVSPKQIPRQKLPTLLGSTVRQGEGARGERSRAEKEGEGISTHIQEPATTCDHMQLIASSCWTLFWVAIRAVASQDALSLGGRWKQFICRLPEPIGDNFTRCTLTPCPSYARVLNGSCGIWNLRGNRWAPGWEVRGVYSEWEVRCHRRSLSKDSPWVASQDKGRPQGPELLHKKYLIQWVSAPNLQMRNYNAERGKVLPSIYSPGRMLPIKLSVWCSFIMRGCHGMGFFCALPLDHAESVIKAPALLNWIF